MGAVRVGYLISQYPATSHTFIRREIQALRARGVEVETFSVRPPTEAERRSGVDREEYERTYYILPAKPKDIISAHAKAVVGRPADYLKTLGAALKHRVPGTRAAMWSLFHFAEAIVLASELEARGIEHLHNHFANSGANVGFLASRFLGMDWSLTLHGISEFDYPAGPLLAEKITAARFVACATKFGRAQAMRMVSPAEWDKLVVVRCGLDLSRFERLRPVTPIPPRRAKHRVLSVGRLSPEKGQHGLIQAFAAVRAAGIDAELRILGDGPERSRLENLIQELGLEGSVTLGGRVPAAQVVAELAQSDVFAISSFMEGLPVVLMEALAMEVPVVAPAVAGIPELIQHGESGLLFAVSDWQSLSRKLIRILRDPEVARRLALQGKRRVEAEFDIHKAIEPLMQRFRDQSRTEDQNSSTGPTRSSSSA